MAEIQLRDVPEQLVLTEQRTITAEAIKPWLGEAMDRLHNTAENLGGRTGDWFVVYHGQFGDDTPEIPVEVCAPIGTDQGDGADVATRTEPAHREAFITLTKAQFTNPADIAAAFGQVAGWIAMNGHAIADAPREVYFTDFMAADEQDDVAHIAFPID